MQTINTLTSKNQKKECTIIYCLIYNPKHFANVEALTTKDFMKLNKRKTIKREIKKL